VAESPEQLDLPLADRPEEKKDGQENEPAQRQGVFL